MAVFECDACGATFEIDLNKPPEFGIFCPECGETEDIKMAGLEDCCSTSESVPGTKTHG